MPRAKADTKEPAKTKSKTRAKAKTQVKKTAHAKTKTTKVKAQTKPKAAKKTKAHTTHTKSHAVKTKISAQPAKTRTKSKEHHKPASKFEFSDVQTDILLALVEKIISLRKRRQGGLRTFYNIDRILDKYNQRYSHPIEKLDAIIKYGMEKDPHLAHRHFYVVINGRGKDEDSLYQILSGMGHGKIKFEDAKNKMKEIYEESAHEK